MFRFLIGIATLISFFVEVSDPSTPFVRTGRSREIRLYLSTTQPVQFEQVAAQKSSSKKVPVGAATTNDDQAHGASFASYFIPEFSATAKSLTIPYLAHNLSIPTIEKPERPPII